jgi:hypothetical protein
LNDPLFLKARRQGRREDVKWHGVHLLWEQETRTNINALGIVSEGGHDDDMSTDSRRDVMPGCMGGEEKVKARGEDGRANHETAPNNQTGITRLKIRRARPA